MRRGPGSAGTETDGDTTGGPTPLRLGATTPEPPMAIFRLRANIVSRARAQSVLATAAYRAGEKLNDPNRARDHDYSRRGGVEHSSIATTYIYLDHLAGCQDTVDAAVEELLSGIETPQCTRAAA
jgi:MobA/MobL family protein